MRTWQASFKGRQKGAIGVFYHINVEVMADTLNEVIEKLYEKYEHISELKIEAAQNVR